MIARIFGKLTCVAVAALVAFPLMVQSRPAAACGTEPYLGTLCLFAGNFAPRGYKFANGEILSIAQNTALFSILGTTYGGNGVTTFALPDLRGRVPLSAGQGPGLSNYVLGEQVGVEATTLTIGQMPSHTHGATATAQGTTAAPTAASPANAAWATLPRDQIYAAGAPNAPMAPNTVAVTIAPAGGSQPVGVMQPSLAINWIIAVVGIYPPRD